MDLGLLRRILEERRGSALAEIIPSTEGEPLLYPEIDGLLDLCGAAGVKVNLTTNGTFPGRGAAAWAERLAPACSDVKVSWNGAAPATAEAVMPGLRFADAVEGIRDFAAVRDRTSAAGGGRCRLSFQVTAMEPNVAELPEIVRLAGSLGVDRVKMNQLQVHFAELRPLSLRRSAGSIRSWNEAVRACRRAAEEVRRRHGREVLLENVVELEPDPHHPAPLGACRFLGQEAWVTVDGRFAPCPAPQRERLGELGSLCDRTLGEIWESEGYRDLCRDYRSRPVCRECCLRRPGGA
jgi:MoaA/NifB/PqqE/SkfB family radical SAM enzyme